MTTSSADTRHPLGAASPAPPHAPAGARGAAPPGLALGLAVTLMLAFAALLVAAVVLAVHPDLSIITNNFGDQQNQSAKTALYVIAFVVVLPLALVVAPRLADRIAAGPNGAALGILTGALAAALAAAFAVVRLSAKLPWGDGLGVLLVVLAIWWLAAVAALARAARPVAWPALLRAAGLAAGAWAAAAALALVILAGTATVRSIDWGVLIAGLAVAAAIVALYARRRVPHVPRPWGPLIDVVALVLLLFAVPDTVIYETSSALPNVFFPPGILQYHHDFLLGPANQLLHGGALLVDDPVSQYGVGSVYFLAGYFHLAPIGYGTYAALGGILCALFYGAGYCVLRLAGASRLLAASTLALGVVVFIYNLAYPIGSLPQQGPLRFGLPMAIVLATVAARRWPRAARGTRALALLVLAVSAVWSLEGFAYTLFTYAAMVAVEGWLEPAGGRLRWIARQAALAVTTIVAAHLIFAAATLAGSGSLPDWGEYLDYLRAFVLGGKGSVGQQVYGFAPWSPGLAIAALYLASAAAIVLAVHRRTTAVTSRPPALIALAGLTAYGIAVFSYSDNRSSTYLLLYVGLPALLAGALWLSLVLGSGRVTGRRGRLGALAFALALAAVLLAAVGPVGDRFSRSGLAHARPGGGLHAAVQRLWHMAPIDPRAPQGQALLARYMPGESHSLVLLPSTPDLSVEILMRSGRANRLPLGNPNEGSFVPQAILPMLRDAIGGLHAGDRLLLDREALALAAKMRARPEYDPLARAVPGDKSLDEWILQRIGERFALRRIASGPGKFVVVELERRR